MRPIILGIAGGSGSGKTSVTRAVIERLDPSQVAVLDHDSYYHDLPHFRGLPTSEINFDHPESLDTSLLIDHLRQLRGFEPIPQPIYDFGTYRRRLETRTVAPKPIIIVEGILIFAEPDLRREMDVKIYVDTDADERLMRRLRRDIVQRGRQLDGVLGQYMKTVKPMHLEFVEPSKRWADVIVPRGGENLIAINMIVAKINALLDRSVLLPPANDPRFEG